MTEDFKDRNPDHEGAAKATGQTMLRVKSQEMLQAQRMCRYPDYTIEQVANHYSRMAMLASKLRVLTEKRRHNPSSTLDALILHYLRLLNNDHERSFGLEPVWMSYLQGSGT